MFLTKLGNPLNEQHHVSVMRKKVPACRLSCFLSPTNFPQNDESDLKIRRLLLARKFLAHEFHGHNNRECMYLFSTSA